MKISAGLLMYRMKRDLEFFLVHPGGPYFARKDEGSWTIPKGEPAPGEPLQDAAVREFEEETALSINNAQLIYLGSVTQKSGKEVHAWAFEGELPRGFKLVSNTFEMQWPPRSGQMRLFPEIDQAEFFPFETALEKINEAQRGFLYSLKEKLTGG